MREWHCVTEQEYHEAKAKGLQVRDSASMTMEQYHELRRLFEFTMNERQCSELRRLFAEPGSYFAFATLDELGRDDIQASMDLPKKGLHNIKSIAQIVTFLREQAELRAPENDEGGILQDAANDIEDSCKELGYDTTS